MKLKFIAKLSFDSELGEPIIISYNIIESMIGGQASYGIAMHSFDKKKHIIDSCFIHDITVCPKRVMKILKSFIKYKVTVVTALDIAEDYVNS